MRTYDRRPDDPDREQLFVGISEYEVVNSGETLIAYGLGACVGIVVYDPENDVGGLGCAMLPRQSDGAGASDGKYADTAIEALVRDAISAGASYGGLEGYIVGGSDLLDLNHLPREVSKNTVAAAREKFAELAIPLKGSAVGGSQGRTVEFHTDTGRLRIITADDPEPRLLRRADQQTD